MLHGFEQTNKIRSTLWRTSTSCETSCDWEQNKMATFRQTFVAFRILFVCHVSATNILNSNLVPRALSPLLATGRGRGWVRGTRLKSVKVRWVKYAGYEVASTADSMAIKNQLKIWKWKCKDCIFQKHRVVHLGRHSVCIFFPLEKYQICSADKKCHILQRVLLQAIVVAYSLVLWYSVNEPSWNSIAI